VKEFTGLSSAEVRERVANDQTNDMPDRSSRRLRDILRANIFTRFNALLTVLAIAVIAVGGGAVNALFFAMMVVNSGIGIFQEWRAKRMLDRLAILAAPSVTVVRDGHDEEIAVKDVVQDDLIKLKLGDQIVADGPILASDELEVDESLLTGEADPIVKKAGDKVLSGSMVVAGGGMMQAAKIGTASYSARLTLAVKKFQPAHSELVDGINTLLKWISLLFVIVAPILIVGQLYIDRGDWQSSVLHSVAALIGIIPEGLVLLTSAAFLLAAIQLAQQKVLMQQMSAVETLARVDMLLLDKTGTLTEGNIRYDATIREEDFAESQVDSVLATIASRAKSPTNNAIARALHEMKPAKFAREIPFSSARKWSAIEIDGQSFVFGAPEIIFANNKKAKMFREAQSLAATGKRVLVLVNVKKFPADEKIPVEISPVATVILSERVREDATETLQFFAQQHVDIKIISGDSPLTVAAVAKMVGLKHVKEYNARDLPDAENSPEKFAKIIANYNVFGRVQPEQKRQIVAALQNQNHVVAMTGDGVNDALALKKADLGIAMASGASATKAIAETVLLDNKFSHLPSVLAAGRQVMANVERVANLFIVKNVYSLALALGVTVMGLTYPYLPIQMTVISVLSIGAPAFFLALTPNAQIYHAGFLKRVLRFSVPVGIVAAIAMITNYYLIHHRGMSLTVAGTSVSITLMMIVLTVIILLAKPLRGWKLGLILACALAFVAMLLIPNLASAFSYDLDLATLPATFAIGGIGVIMVVLIKRIDEWFDSRKTQSFREE